MTMGLKDLLPLCGVVIGWLLKEVSDSVRRSSETRATLGTALLGLLDLDGELRRLNMALTFQKNRPITWEQYETIRQAAVSRYLTRTNPIKAVEAAHNIKFLVISHGGTETLRCMKTNRHHSR